MDAFLGFIVLTGPLFFIVLWVPVCIFLAVLVGRKFIKKSLSLKIAGGMAVFLVTLLLPIADEIAGRIYFNHLCKTEAGVKVYQTIELPAEYWDEDGKPKFYDGNTLPDNEYVKAGVKAEAIEKTQAFGVQEFGTVFKEKNSDYKQSEVIGFRYWGGWLIRNFSPHNTAISCGGGKSYDELVEKQFIPLGSDK